MCGKQILQQIITGCSCGQGANQGVGRILDQRYQKFWNLPLAPPLTEFIIIFFSPPNYTLSNVCLSYLFAFLWMMKFLRSTIVFFF